MSTFVQGDSAPALAVSANLDLTGATVQLHIEKPDGTILSVVGNVTDAVNGLVSYAWAPTDIDQIGVWAVEAQITFSNNQVQTVGPATFSVRPQIA